MRIEAQRRNEVGKSLNGDEIALFFAGKPPTSTADTSYKMRSNKTFYYLTSLSCEGYILAVKPVGNGTESILFIEEPVYDKEKWVGKKLTKEDAKEISGVEKVMYLQDFEPFMAKIFLSGNTKKLMLDLDRLRYEDEVRPIEFFARDIRLKYPQIEIGSISPLIAQMRLIKSEDEIEKMRKAIDMTDEGIRAIYEKATAGVYQYELEAEFAYQIRRRGADGNSFETIVASGSDGVILHYVENNKQINDGDLVLLDLGAQYKEYAADISRTFPVNGKFTERQKEYYNLVLKAQMDVMKIMKPGTKFSAMNEEAKRSLAESLIKMGKIQKEEEVSKYYYHGVGHYLGLDVHDVGERDTTLQAGMVITCEPGIYVADENIGIRIEDDILITEDGNEVLSAKLPKTVEEIEKLLSQK